MHLPKGDAADNSNLTEWDGDGACRFGVPYVVPDSHSRLLRTVEGERLGLRHSGEHQGEAPCPEAWPVYHFVYRDSRQRELEGDKRHFEQKQNPLI